MGVFISKQLQLKHVKIVIRNVLVTLQINSLYVNFKTIIAKVVLSWALVIYIIQYFSIINV